MKYVRKISVSFRRIGANSPLSVWQDLSVKPSDPGLLFLEVKVKSLSRVPLFATPSTVAHQAPLSMGFSRQEYWSGLSFPFPGDLPDPGIKPRSPALQADTLTSEPPGRFFLLLFYFVMFPKLYYDNFFTNVYP